MSIVDPARPAHSPLRTITVRLAPHTGDLQANPWGPGDPIAQWPFAWLVIARLLSDRATPPTDSLVTLQGEDYRLLAAEESAIDSPIVVARQLGDTILLETPGTIPLRHFWCAYWHLVADALQQGTAPYSACLIDSRQAALAGPWLTCLRIARMAEPLPTAGRYLPAPYCTDPIVRDWLCEAIDILESHLDEPRYRAAERVRGELRAMQLRCITPEELAHSLRQSWCRHGLFESAYAATRSALHELLAEAAILQLPISETAYRNTLLRVWEAQQ